MIFINSLYEGLGVNTMKLKIWSLRFVFSVRLVFANLRERGFFGVK
jgi:hypothetical protein